MSLPEISDDAKAVMGAYFGTTMQTTVTFMMIEARPSPRCRAALTELESKGYIRTTPIVHTDPSLARVGSVKIIPLTDGQPYLRWLLRNSKKAQFDLTEDIPK